MLFIGNPVTHASVFHARRISLEHKVIVEHCRALVECQVLFFCGCGLQFSEGRIAPAGARIVYVDGAFDLFHPGHVAFLQVRNPAGLPYFHLPASACCA
jgi:hypothetical protein